MVTFRNIQCHPGLTYIFNFWHSCTLGAQQWAPECPNARN